MAATQNNKEIVNGVQGMRIATLLADGSIDQSSWAKAENFAPGSVVYTSNQPTITSIIPEDKFTAIFTIATPGDPDTINFNCFELSVENYQRFFNTNFDASTNTIIVLAQQKRARLAIELTTQPVNGVKKIFTYPNVECQVGYAENFTKEALVQLAVVGQVQAYTTFIGGVETEALYSLQTVNEDGSIINANPPVVTGGANQNITTDNATLVGTETPVSPKTILSRQWSVVSKPAGSANVIMATPTALSNAVSGLEDGVYIFKLTSTDSAGIQGSATTQVTVAIP